MAAADKKRYEEEMAQRGQTTGTSKKKEADDGIKKPQSAYLLFGKDHREKLLKTKPDTKAPDVMKSIGEAWSKISEKEKERYNKLALKDKERFEKEKGAVKPAATKSASK